MAAASANDYSVLIKHRVYRQHQTCSPSADQQSKTPESVEKTIECGSKSNETVKHESAMKPQPVSKRRECVDAIEEEMKTDDIEEEKKEHRDR